MRPRGEGWELEVRAPAREGKANAAAIEVLAAALGVRQSGVELLHGARSREKVFALRGLAPEELRERLEALRRQSS